MWTKFILLPPFQPPGANGPSGLQQLAKLHFSPWLPVSFMDYFEADYQIKDDKSLPKQLTGMGLTWFDCP